MAETIGAGEVRVINERTGGAKGSKPCQLAWAPAHALQVLGEVYGHGAVKYDAQNYRRGYDWSLSLNALYRHLLAFQGGEDNDPGSGLPHMGHVAWHALTLVQFMHDHPEMDDRFDSLKPSTLEAADELDRRWSEAGYGPDVGEPITYYAPTPPPHL